MNSVDVVQVRLVKERELISEKEIHSSYDVYELMAEEMKSMNRECVAVMNLNSRNQVISVSFVAVGKLAECPLEARDTFIAALLANSSALILMHNHPSGDVTPSQEDLEATKRMVACGELMGIRVLDHVIIGGYSGERYSFLEHGLMTTHELDEYLKRNYIPAVDRRRPSKVADDPGSNKESIGTHRRSESGGKR